MKIYIQKDGTDDKILNHELNNDNNKEFNWIICNQDKLPLRMIFQKYKTHFKYKDYIEDDIPLRLKTLLQLYIKSSKLTTHNFLFPQAKNKNKGQEEPNFSTGLSKDIFKVYTADYDENWKKIGDGKRITVNTLRHSYISWVIGKKYNMTQLEKIALKMCC